MSPSSLDSVPPAWRFALIGTIASLPIAALLNRLPNTEATIGGSIMLIGAFLAGAIAAIHATDPAAAGLRAGFLGGVLAAIIFPVTIASTPASSTISSWSLSSIGFWVFAVGLALCIAPLFGLVTGRLGGWIADTVGSRAPTITNPPK
jgi:hypothetical protein